ncbi:MAG: PH domain-containing protein [Pseudomonadota bacterium]
MNDGVAALPGDGPITHENVESDHSQYGRLGAPLEGSYNLGLTPLHPPQKQVIRISTALMFLPVLIGLVIADAAIASEGGTFGPISLVALVLYALIVVVLPGRKYRRWGYAMESDRLRVLRGFLFRTDTIVPFNRIQHIDVGQGPIERMCGVATLVVHTAGTHNSIVTLPGLEPGTADAMRDEMRRHIRREMI